MYGRACHVYGALPGLAAALGQEALELGDVDLNVAKGRVLELAAQGGAGFQHGGALLGGADVQSPCPHRTAAWVSCLEERRKKISQYL